MDIKKEIWDWQRLFQSFRASKVAREKALGKYIN